MLQFDSGFTSVMILLLLTMITAWRAGSRMGPGATQCSTLLALVFWTTSLPAAGAFRIVSVKPVAKPAPSTLARSATLATSSTTGEIPPIEGPLFAVAITVSDQRGDEFDFSATAHAGVDGSPLIPGSGYEIAVALLDSGASTHLVGYPDAVRFGLQDFYLTANTFDAEGACGAATLDISQPVGFFAHGLQDRDASGNIRPDLMFGQGNFASGVNSLLNEEDGIRVPTVLGAPFFMFFPAYLRNSQPVEATVFGRTFSTASITFYDDAANPDIPQLARRIFLETRPSGGSVSYLSLFDPEPLVPSVILAGFNSALYFTASDMVFTNRGNRSAGRMLVDTGAQGTILGEIAAAELDLDMNNPDFEAELEGLGCRQTRPGFYIDTARLPAQGGAITWAKVPVVILNVASPEGGTLFGIFGSNLIATRDAVFNGAASTPYLDVTEPVVKPVLRITTVRMPTTNSIEIGWRTEPAPPVLRLEATPALTVDPPPQWTAVATGAQSTITGTMSVTGLVSRQFFRLVTP
jgi:hypothetical protein